jgi:hypothetical protein
MWVDPKVVIVPTLSEEMEQWVDSVGPGWRPLLERYARNIDYQVSKGDMPPVSISQVKEKFGTLRIYTQGGNELSSILEAFIEDLSGYYCEDCGKLASMGNKQGWFRTTCEDHK